MQILSSESRQLREVSIGRQEEREGKAEFA